MSPLRRLLVVAVVLGACESGGDTQEHRGCLSCSDLRSDPPNGARFCLRGPAHLRHAGLTLCEGAAEGGPESESYIRRTMANELHTVVRAACGAETRLRGIFAVKGLRIEGCYASVELDQERVSARDEPLRLVLDPEACPITLGYADAMLRLSDASGEKLVSTQQLKRGTCGGEHIPTEELGPPDGWYDW